MKVFSKPDSFIAVYCSKLSIFSFKKCRIQTQILHFMCDKYKFNKVFIYCGVFSFFRTAKNTVFSVLTYMPQTIPEL